ncbi:cupin [Streptomyces sp. SBT349]|uniref:cupin n=1 Tax=Streptomyces sp. SBT349 TaxID=1580539 RepID=UPI00066E189C|nr:cupin [Streptomyces sp. SBT349]
MRTTRRTVLTGAAVVAMTLAGGTAHATPPGQGVTGTVIARTTVGDTDYILRELTIPPGQATGWHYHDGPVHGYIERGVLSHYDATCGSDGVYPAGTTIAEPHGPDEVHLGRNEGTEPIVLYALYVLPHGAPLANDAPNPGCDLE